jgi:OOP family OmpA-OmpF porin
MIGRSHITGLAISLLVLPVMALAQENEIFFAGDVEIGQAQNQPQPSQDDLQVGFDPLVECFVNASSEACNNAAPSLSDSEFESSMGDETLELSVYLVDAAGKVVEKPTNNTTDYQTDASGSEAPSINITVEFDYNSASIRQSELYKLSQIASAISHPATNGSIFALVGHTDAKGSHLYNCDLSERRAWSVRSFLSSQGVARATGL